MVPQEKPDNHYVRTASSPVTLFGKVGKICILQHIQLRQPELNAGSATYYLCDFKGII